MTIHQLRYSCCSRSGVCIQGVCVINGAMTRDELTSDILGRVAKVVETSHVPWDPFNIELIVRAQSEPKPFQEIK
jgi:hypothetical protein